MSRRVLVVDDEQGIRAALGQLLEYEGYEVRTASQRAPTASPSTRSGGRTSSSWT